MPTETNIVYDRAGNILSSTTVVRPPDPGLRMLVPEEFVALLTAAEFDAIATSANPAIIKWRWRALTARRISLDAPATTAMIAGAVALGILTQARADSVLAGLPPP